MLNSKKQIAALCLLAMASPAQAYVWYTYDGHEYALTSTQDTWAYNEAEAESLGGHLVTINDGDENTWLTSTFANTPVANSTDPLWHSAIQIGFYWLETGFVTDITQWGWISGEAVTYTNPDVSFPASSGTMAYLHVDPHVLAGTWNANPPHTVANYYPSMLAYGVIERVVIPEPTSLALLGLGLAGLAASRWRKQ